MNTTTKFLPAGLALNPEPTLPALATIVGKTQEVKGVGFSSAVLEFVACRISTKRNDSGFVLSNFEIEFTQSLNQRRVELLGFVFVLKAAHKVICVPYHVGFTLASRAYSLLKPQVKRIVQVHIGKYRRYHSTLSKENDYPK